MSELLPCPWCWANARTNSYQIRTGQMVDGVPFVRWSWEVHCLGEDEHSLSGCDTQEEAVADWNRRAPSPEVAGLRAEVERLRSAASDMLAGWRYIRMVHGDLPGVGWDRAENAVRSALTPQEPTP